MADFDLDAFIAEQDPGPFTFTFGGQEWVWPPTPDVRAVGHLVADPPRVLDALRMNFKPDDWRRFIDETGGGLDPEGKAIAEILKRHAEHAGSSLGESSASSGSSSTTARRSKPTSPNTTASSSAPSSEVDAGAVSVS